MQASHKLELLLLMGIITVLLFKVASSKRPIDMPQAILLFVTIIAVTYMLLFSQVLESFDNAQAPAKPSDPALADMTVFIASDDTTSYVPGNNTWNNISPLVTAANNAFTFSKVPQATSNGLVATDGVPTKDIVITGPSSSSLGYAGEADFTLFWYAATNTIPANAVTPILVVKGDSENSSINIKVQYDTTATDGSISIVVQHSDDDPEKAKTIYKNSGVHDPYFIMDKATHLFMLIRDSTANQLRLYIDDQDTPLFTGDIKAICTLTNSPMLLNPNGGAANHGWDANLYYFGVYKKALSSVDRSNLNTFIETRQVMTQRAYTTMLSNYNSAQASVAAMKACPFKGQAMCTAECSTVTDWSQPGVLADPKNGPCLQKVVAYCNQDANKAKPECVYWAHDTNQTLNSVVINTVNNNAAGGGTGAIIKAATTNAPLVGTQSMAGVATAINAAVANANANATSTAQKTANVLQNVLTSSGSSLNPVSVSMIQSAITDNMALAAGNQSQSGQVPAVSAGGVGAAAPITSVASQLRTVGANLYSNTTAAVLPSAMASATAAATAPNAPAPALAATSTAPKPPAASTSTPSATAPKPGTVASFVDGATSCNVNAPDPPSRATAANNAMYQSIMDRYTTDIQKNQTSTGLLGTIASIFM